MTSETSRLYSGNADLQLMKNFLSTVRPLNRLADPPSATDLEEMFSQDGIQGRTRLWFDAQGALMAFAYVDDYANLGFEMRPELYGATFEASILEWGKKGIRMLANEQGESGPVQLDASCRDNDANRLAILERFGFQLQPMRSLHFELPLDGPLPEAQLPPGFSLRSAAGESEAEALAALHRAAFDSDYMTTDNRLIIMRTPAYDPGTDLVVIAPDGSMAGNCICYIEEDANQLTGDLVGYTDPVSVHPDFQGRGLARAMLLRGARVLRDRGMKVARLGTSSENLAMQRAALAAGFKLTWSALWFTQTVED